MFNYLSYHVLKELVQEVQLLKEDKLLKEDGRCAKKYRFGIKFYR